jgi:uncharacterized protein (DUF488 family)
MAGPAGTRVKSIVQAPRTIWTIGHSNLTLESFRDHVRDIDLLADIRRYPYSPKYPHFNGESLETWKGYRWFPDLGGRRRDKGERHTAWRVSGFRAYAGHMETGPFHEALDLLQAVAVQRRTALLCAEALWWRCHRRLVSDALVVLGWQVIHLPGEQVHELSPMARIADGILVYDQPARLPGGGRRRR